jgi:Myb-like DNA-binding domain
LSQSEQQVAKGKWSPQEDNILRGAVTKMGAQRWTKIAELLPGRLGKHCRNRWCQHLAPHVRKGEWGLEEDYAILKGHAQHGNRWALIARDILGRTDNAIKNRFHSSMKAKIEMYLMHRRGTNSLEIDSYGRYDYQDDLAGCLWMVHGVPGGHQFIEYRGDYNNGDYCEYVRIFAAEWKKSSSTTTTPHQLRRHLVQRK